MSKIETNGQSAGPLLEVHDLSISLGGRASGLRLVEGISFALERGEILGIVGESGSGKTLVGMSLMRLLMPTLETTGSAIFEGRDLLSVSEREMRRVRGRHIGMVFQEPVGALNPVFTIGSQISAVLRTQHGMTRRQARDRTIELLRRVGIPDPASRLGFYPHQLSGGMCQRVMIAMALASGAGLLIADEPTTSLDVTIQKGIVSLLEDIVREDGISVIFISHDLGLVSQICGRVAVFYSGQVVEMGSAHDILRYPRHPYTKGLVRCVPNLDAIGVLQRGIPGTPPTAGQWPAGCRFQPRCAEAEGGRCSQPQVMHDLAPGHRARCWKAEASLSACAS